MNSCNQCDAKDQITIAGKQFCANCGTPVTPQPVSDATTVAAQTNTKETDSPTPVKNELADSITQSLQQSNNSSSEPTPVTPATPEPVAPPSPASTATGNTNNASSNPLPNDAATSQKQADVQPTTTPASNIQKFSPKPTTVVPTSPAAQPTPNAPTPVAVQPSVSVDAIKTTAPETIGNEISSLDAKDDDVFSDEQFDQLKNMNHPAESVRPAHAQISTPPKVRPMSDIKPQSTTTPTTIATQPAAQQPAMDSLVNAAVAHQPKQPSPPVINTLAQPQTPPQSRVAQMPSESANVSKNTSKKKGATIGSIALTVVGLFLVGAYIWQVNYPNLALKVASSKAGLNASLPSYLPNGWKVAGDISASPGEISYKLASDNGKGAVVSQSKTDWDSQALAENYVVNKANNYLALQAQGLTIYVYGNNQASWVNHGTLYKIDGGDSGMNQDQLIRMATSL